MNKLIRQEQLYHLQVTLKILLGEIKVCDEGLEYFNKNPTKTTSFSIKYIETNKSMYKIQYLLIKSKYNNTLTDEFKLAMKTKLQQLLSIAMEQCEDLVENGVIDESQYLFSCERLKQGYDILTLLV